MAVLAFATLALKVAVDAGAPRPWLFAMPVAAVGVVGFLAAGPGRRWLDGPRAVLVGLALLLVPTIYGEVGGDGVQALVVVRSVLLDHDLDLANDYAGLGVPVVVTRAGEPTSHLPIGLALLWAPPFAAAHVGVLLARALGASVAADGFSVPYRSAVTAGTYAYGALALLLLESEIRRRHGRGVALLAVLAIWFATPLHFYMTANPAMAHGASVLAATAFVIAWLRERERAESPPRAWAGVGLLGGLMAAVRLQDAVLLALPAADLAVRPRAGDRRRLAAFLAGAAVLGLVQLAAWLRLYGTGFVSTVMTVNLVGGEPPHVLAVLFSPRHGLFYWTPLCVLCVLGWAAWARRERRLAILAAVGFASAVIVNASIRDWWGAEAFGQRRLLGLTPLFALGLGEALGVLGPAGRRLAAAFLAFLALWTFSFEGVYNGGMVAPRDQPITYGPLASAQGEALRRGLVARRGRLPSALWCFAYDRLGGTYADDPALGGHLDLGNEPSQIPFLVGRGWFAPETEDGVTLRRARGEGSWLHVPLRVVGDYEAVVRLRPELSDVPLAVTLEMNREPLGTARVAAGWGEYRFAIPAARLRAGINDLGLLYSTTPRQARPGVAMRNAAVAVDWIDLKPARP